MTTLSKEDVVRTDNDLLAMIQKHFPSLPLDDRYTDWGKWLCFAKAVYSHGEQAARADLVAENDRLKAEVKQLNDEKNWRYVEQILSPIRRLLEVAGAAEIMADNTEEIQRADGLALIVQHADFDKLSIALDLLDDLPDDKPGYVLGGAAKAAWALHDIIGDTNG